MVGMVGMVVMVVMVGMVGRGIVGHCRRERHFRRCRSSAERRAEGGSKVYTLVHAMDEPMMPPPAITTSWAAADDSARWCTATPAEHRAFSANMLVQSKQ